MYKRQLCRLFISLIAASLVATLMWPLKLRIKDIASPSAAQTRHPDLMPRFCNHGFAISGLQSQFCDHGILAVPSIPGTDTFQPAATQCSLITSVSAAPVPATLLQCAHPEMVAACAQAPFYRQIGPVHQRFLFQRRSPVSSAEPSP